MGLLKDFATAAVCGDTDPLAAKKAGITCHHSGQMGHITMDEGDLVYAVAHSNKCRRKVEDLMQKDPELRQQADGMRVHLMALDIEQKDKDEKIDNRRAIVKRRGAGSSAGGFSGWLRRGNRKRWMRRCVARVRRGRRVMVGEPTRGRCARLMQELPAGASGVILPRVVRPTRPPGVSHGVVGVFAGVV